MKGKAIIPLALGLCIGLIAVKMGVDAIKKAKGASPAQATIQVAQAKLDIDMLVAITPEMIELIDTPESSLVPKQDRFETIDDLIGRVTAKAIPQGVPVLGTMLALPGTPPGMVGRIPDGYRAVSVKIDEVTAVAFQLRPGDWVDVIVVMDIRRTGVRRTTETIAEVILQNVQVAAIGQDSSGKSVSGSKKAKAARSATLFVKEADAPKLHLAATRGKITLSMRGDDRKTTDSPLIVRDSDAFASIDRPEPEPPKMVQQAPTQQEPIEEPDTSTPYSVVVINGSTSSSVGPTAERITFENADSSTIIGVTNGVAGGLGDQFRAKHAKHQSRRPNQPQNSDENVDERESDFHEDAE